jgi:pantothenate kinase
MEEPAAMVAMPLPEPAEEAQVAEPAVAVDFIQRPAQLVEVAEIVVPLELLREIQQQLREVQAEEQVENQTKMAEEAAAAEQVQMDGL